MCACLHETCLGTVDTGPEGWTVASGLKSSHFVLCLSARGREESKLKVESLMERGLSVGLCCLLQSELISCSSHLLEW